jgi:biopolymer transport protein ExbB
MEAIKVAAEYFQKGGLVMWPLLFCSLAAMAIGIERYLYYRAADSGSEFTEKICACLFDGNRQEALRLAQTTHGDSAAILSKTLQLAGGLQRQEAYMEAQASLVIARLRANLHYLGVIVTLSPLLGLLGTIIGMIGAFDVFNLRAGQPLAITGGIGEALIATASGLCVAILALGIHSYFAQRLDTAITNMEQCFSSLIEVESRGEQRETA